MLFEVIKGMDLFSLLVKTASLIFGILSFPLYNTLNLSMLAWFFIFFILYFYFLVLSMLAWIFHNQIHCHKLEERIIIKKELVKLSIVVVIKRDPK